MDWSEASDLWERGDSVVKGPTAVVFCSAWQVHAGANRDAGLPTLSLLFLHVEVCVSIVHGCPHHSQHHPAGGVAPRLQCLD